jgi:hypothetical protein
VAVAGGWGRRAPRLLRAGGRGEDDSFPSGPGVVAIGVSSKAGVLDCISSRKLNGKGENGLKFLRQLHRSLTCGTARRSRGRPRLSRLCLVCGWGRTEYAWTTPSTCSSTSPRVMHSCPSAQPVLPQSDLGRPIVTFSGYTYRGS